jgi:hypothetical protein
LDLPFLDELWNLPIMKCAALPVLTFLGLIQFAGAVVQVSGSANNTAPSGQPYFQNIGTLNGASAIYLDNGWVMTANHVASSLPASVKFGGVDYVTESGSFQRLNNPFPSLSTFTDIVLFRLSVAPPLLGLGIATATPTVGSQVMMIGNGRIQESTTTEWNYTQNPGPADDTWMETSPGGGNIVGFKTNSTQEVRWGENVVSQNLFTVNVGTVPAPVDVISYATEFNDGALANEAQGVVGDSGGGVFAYDGSSWQLTGMIYAVNLHENQPNGAQTAVFGDQTLIADLAYYQPQIMTIIPEPSSLGLTLLGGCLIARRRR